MLIDFKQFVPSEYCLSCRGCCVFKTKDDRWRPQVTLDDARVLNVPPGPLAATVHEAAYRCSFLNEPDHHCQVYDKRPFECRLYPFLVSFEKDGLKVYAHQACPYVQDNLRTDEGRSYLAYLRAWLTGVEARQWLLVNRTFFPDYSFAHQEVEQVCKIEEEDLFSRQAELTQWLRARRSLLSANSFVAMAAWKDQFTFTFDEIDGNLCVFAAQPAGSFLYWPPLGDKISPLAIEECFRRLRKKNNAGGLTRIENVSKEDLAAFDTGRYEIALRGYEYLYCRQDITDLKGDDYKSRRHDINVLLGQHQPTYRPFFSVDSGACLELFERWLDKRCSQYEDGIYRAMLQENRGVHRLLMEQADRLGIIGRVVVINGRIVGYTFGYPLQDDIFCDLLEVTDPDIPGLGAFIFREFCQDAAVQKFSFINAMDDFGMPNIAQVKMSYRPAILEPVYTVTEKDRV